MKKLLLSVLVMAVAYTVSAQCTDLIISEYAEGANNNKALELYNPTNSPIALNNLYRLVRYNNGTGAAAGEANAQASINLGAHVMQPGEAWVIVIDKRDAGQPCPGQECAVSAALQAVADTFLCPDYNVSYAMYFNGNDALSLQKNVGGTWQYVDIFGKIGDPSMVTGFGWSDVFPYDGSAPGSRIWTENHTLVRKANVMQGVTTNPTNFIVNVEWDSLPNQTWTGLGSHTCNCAITSIQEQAASSIPVSVFPNPSSLGYVTVAASETIKKIELFNAIGRSVITPVVSTTSSIRIETEGLTAGIYFVKTTFDNNRTTVVKLSIQ
ncbi:MAG: lamin tail domain-containing protein [Bacteroidia bacterium]|nr:lamin tail domain-containing protein [Bacteroidia bacterium]